MSLRDAPMVAVIGRDGIVTGSGAMTPWWSFTKTLIAAAVMRLAERGRVSLDAEVDGLGASPRALLLHRAGLADYGWLRTYHEAVARGDQPWPEETMLAALPARRPVGGFSYSNVGYLHLRRLIEHAAGAPFAAALHEILLAPLGLTARVAGDRRDMEACAVAADRAYHPGWVYHGLVVGPVIEAAQALHRLLASDFLAPSSRAAMQAARSVDAPVGGRPWVTTGYGLGLMTGTVRSGRRRVTIAGHSAGGPGSAGAVYHAHGRTVAVFTSGPGEARAEHVVARRLAQT